MGYGESIGALIAEDGLLVPEDSELSAAIHKGQGKRVTEEELEKAAAAADLRALIHHFKLKTGNWLSNTLTRNLVCHTELM